MKPRLRLTIIAVLGLSLLYAFWWLVLRPPGPDEVARTAATALARGDVETLLRLTSPEERQRLNLTPYNVRAVLTDTLYARGPLGRLAIRQVSHYPVDEPSYLLTPLDRHDLPGRLSMRVSEQPNGRWYLPLGYMLLVAYGASRQFQDSMERRRGFLQEASKYGIRGVRLNETGYEYFGYPPAHA